MPDIDDILNRFKMINCGENYCIHFCFNNDDWPDCDLKETSIFNGYIKGYGFDEIDCPFFKPKLKVL